MTSFYLAFLIAAAALVLLAVWAGKATRKQALGILIDGRGRFSLSQLQIVMWTVLVVSVWVGLFFATYELAAIPQTLVVLMGISVGSAAAAGAVKSAKDLDPNAKVAVAGVHPMSSGPTTLPPRLSQVVTEEEGDQADKTVSVTKFQNLVFTLFLGIAFLVMALKSRGFPEIPQEALWLLGVSHAGYVGGKMPNRQ